MGLDQQFFIMNKEQELEKEIYMRKLNIIQGYFEREYGINNLETLEFDIKDIELLHKNSIKVLESKDVELGKELLPIQYGLFYGNYEYNDWYWKDVKEVFEVTKEILDFFKKECHVIQYWCWY